MTTWVNVPMIWKNSIYHHSFLKDFLNIPLFTTKTVLELNLLAVNVDFLIASLLW